MQLLTWPEIHGALTHFPIAMLLTGIVFDLAGHLFKKEDFRKVGFWMLVVAVLGAVGALISGWITQGAWFPTAAKPPILYQHRLAAFTTAGLALVLLAWRWAKKDNHTGPALYASLALGLLLAGAAGFVGYLGGKMAIPSAASMSGSQQINSTQASDKAKPGQPKASSSQPAYAPALIAAGQKAFSSADLGCVSCHSMNGVGGRQAPDLSHEGSYHPDIKWQIKHLNNPQSVNKNSTMPPYQGTDPATLKAVAAYLVSQK